MKKLLLSSIIMIAVCGYATAQNATGTSKFQKAETPAAAPAPQKAAVATEAVSTDTKSATDKAAAQQAVAPAPAGKRATQSAATTVSADGVVVPVSDAAPTKEELKKAEAAKVAAEKAARKN